MYPLDDESADILGGPIIQNSEVIGFKNPWAKLPLSLRATLILGFMSWLLFKHVRHAVLRWREYSHKKAMRRRHGIPDNDNRPFTVAYAAAMRARADREAQSTAHTQTQQPSDQPQPSSSSTRRNALADGQRVIQRLANTNVGQHVSAPRSIYGYSSTTAVDHQKQTDRPLDFARRYDPQSHLYSRHEEEEEEVVEEHVPVPQSDDDAATPFWTRPASRRVSTKKAKSNETKKRSWDDEIDGDGEGGKKKKRVEGEDDLRGTRQPRGAKRSYAEEVESDDLRSNSRDKRSRRYPDASPENEEEDIDEDYAMETEEDDVGELRSLTIKRGKKRDRAEAGSTFAGDDDEVGVNEDEVLTNGKGVKRTKRRTVLRRKETGKGKKREHEGQQSDESPAKNKSKKRGKKTSNRDRDRESDISMESTLSSPSKDPLSRGRKVDEEWEASGVTYKLGLGGERLRLTLVKKARSRFPMPQDSQHPDRAKNMEIYVETWMTDEQYKQAEARHELVWQETPRGSAEPAEPCPLSPIRPKASLADIKNTIDEAKNPQTTEIINGSMSRRPFRQSLVGVNPFKLEGSAPGRRVASSYNVPSPGVGVLGVSTMGGGESPTRRTARFSKWEKQDLEAEAMAKMRAKVQEQKKAAAGPEKSVCVVPEVKTTLCEPMSGAGSASTSVTTGAGGFSFAKPADKTQMEGKPATTTPSLFGPTPSFASSGASRQPENKPAAASAPEFSFGNMSGTPKFPATANTGEQKPADKSVNPFSQPAVTAAAPSPFSFGVPKLETKPTQPTAAGSALPNFFAKSGPAISTMSAPTVPAIITTPAHTFGGFGGDAEQKPSEAPSGPSLISRLDGFAPLQGQPQPPVQAGGTLNFGKPATPAGGDQTKPTSVFGGNANSASTSAYMTSRIGGFAQPPSQNGRAFSFGKPTPLAGGEQAKPSTIFGGNGNNASANNTTPDTSSKEVGKSDAAPLKFDFGIKAKPVGAATKPATPPNTSSTTSAFPSASTFPSSTMSASAFPSATNGASSESKPATSVPLSFSFGNPANFAKIPFGNNSPASPFGNATSSANTNANAGPSTPSGDQKFSFAQPASGSGSGFGPTGADASSSTPKTVFGFGIPTSTPNAFSSTPAGSPAKPFLFVPQTSLSTAESKPGEESKPTSIFGASGTRNQPTSGAFSFGDATGSTNAFGSSASPAAASAATNKPAGFGSTGFGQTTGSTTQQSIFGNPAQTQPATPSAFGFGKPNGGSNVFGFGQPSASGQNQQQKQ